MKKLFSLLLLAVLVGCQSPTPKISVATAAPAAPAHKPLLVLVGDSTVTDKAGWGAGFKQFLTTNVDCINTSAGGRSSKSFIREGRWTNALALHGDYYLIQFGHNDEPGKGDRTTDPDTTFTTNMTRYVEEVRAQGGQPILVTSLTRRQWDKGSTNQITSSLVPYVEAVKRIAAAKNVPLIDLHARSKTLCEQLGKANLVTLSPTKEVNGTNQIDGTHLNARGSVVFARLVVEDLRKLIPALAPLLRTEPLTAPRVKTFNVRDSGATGDSHTLDTAAIQKAIDACGHASGGVVQFPRGTYLSQPLFLRNGVTLQLDDGATLQATDNFADFANPAKSNAVVAFINGDTLTDIGFTGSGVIDGAGAKWWAPVKAAKKSGAPETRKRPRLVLLNKCVGVRISGVTLQNSPSFHLVPTDCEDVILEKIKILAPADSPNTDAIDPTDTRHLIIRNCTLDVGDDNIAIKSGHADSAHPDAACEDILVEACTFLHGHGMSIGSETVGGVKDLTVRNCTFTNTTSGIRIKSDRTRGGVVDGCTYSNLTMTNVKIPINLTCYYPKIPTNDVAQPLAEKTPRFRNFKISHVTASSPQSVGVIVGLPESAITNVTFDHVTLTAPEGLTVRNAQAIRFTDSQISVTQKPALILEANADVTGLATE
jgi:polygalacturonase/lysophospholipase L1-like esterase